ncbi:MAG: hypothetical protein RMK99_02080 [Anaerolineales bacterium]|nr:hypothetical protein [Anaerolineales bacterium]
MSKIRKARKLRTPNVPLAVGPTKPTTEDMAAATRGQAGEPIFDYTYTKRDLARIGMLAGTFIALLIILSFFIR